MKKDITFNTVKKLKENRRLDKKEIGVGDFIMIYELYQEVFQGDLYILSYIKDNSFPKGAGVNAIHIDDVNDARVFGENCKTVKDFLKHIEEENYLWQKVDIELCVSVKESDEKHQEEIKEGVNELLSTLK